MLAWRGACGPCSSPYLSPMACRPCFSPSSSAWPCAPVQLFLAGVFFRGHSLACLAPCDVPWSQSECLCLPAWPHALVSRRRWVQSECLSPPAWHSALVSWRRCSLVSSSRCSIRLKSSGSLSYKCLSYESLSYKCLSMARYHCPSAAICLLLLGFLCVCFCRFSLPHSTQFLFSNRCILRL